VQQRLRWSAAAAGVVFTILIAVFTTALWLRASRAEKRAVNAENDAKGARNEAVKAADEVKQARELEARARQAERNGNAALAQTLNSQAQQLTEQSKGRQVLTPGEAQEVERLRTVAADMRTAAADHTEQLNKLQIQYDEVSKRFAASATELNRWKDASAAATRERDAVNEQLTAVRADLKTSLDERNALKTKLDEALAKPIGAAEPPPKGNYRDIYERAITLKNRKQWKEAERQFEAAARLKGDTGESIAMQGLGTEPYLPNYQLGLVRRQLACEALDRADKDGAVKTLKDASAFADQLKACGTR
jgi:chromosome segregation ATPase